MRGIKMRRVCCLFVVVVWWASCTRDIGTLQDGFYSAQAAVFDEFGWKEYVNIRVSGGKIIVVEYNAFNASGFIKSWDMNYMRIMNAANGTYPTAYTRYYAGQLLKDQGTGKIDMLSGASHSYHSFIRLADAAIQNARNGFTETRTIVTDH